MGAACEKKSEIAVAIVAVVLLVASVVSIACIGRYNYPSADDYSGSARTAAIIADGGSLADVANDAVFVAKDSYVNWQGSYTCTFALCLCPIALGENAYHLVPTITLLLLFLCICFFVFSVLRMLFAASGCSCITIASIITFMSVQFLPSPVEGLFWYSGAATYTGTYCLSLLLLGCAARLCSAARARGRSLWLVLSLVLSLLCGGANYHTAFITSGLLAILALWQIFVKRDKLNAVFASSVALTQLLCFLANVLAPGNAKRIEFFGLTGVKRNILTVVGCAFEDGARLLRSSAGFGLAFCLLALAPIFWNLCAKRKYHYRFPIAVLAFSFCVVCAGFAPITYAYGAAGTAPGRFQNLAFFSLCWFLAFNEFYMLGWLRSKLPELKGKSAMFCSKLAAMKAQKRVCFAVVALVLCAVVVWVSAGGNFTSRTAYTLLRDGSAQSYGAQMQALIDQCRNPKIAIPTTAPFSNRPILLWYNGPTTEATWVNDVMGQYYGKKTVSVIDG